MLNTPFGYTKPIQFQLRVLMESIEKTIMKWTSYFRVLAKTLR